MLAKLLTLLGGAKGAALVVVVAGAAATTGVVATNPDVQQTVQKTVEQVTGSTDCSHNGQPAVVAGRNDLDKMLRDAFQDDQTALAKLHSAKVESADRSKLNDLVNEADAKLRARLTKALNDVAAQTLGRVGLVENAASTTTTTTTTTETGSCDRGANVAFSDSDRTNLETTVVTPAIADMDGIVKDATAAADKLTTSAPAKPAEAGSGQATPARPTGSPSR
jgi:hypothetical protein